jgi:predicted NACHT family NTPase
MASISKQIYPWKRFWCQRSDTMNLTPEGYLSDPDSQWGNVNNPNLVTLDKIADIPCLILLGEPGIGKSQEMQNLVEYTQENLKPSHLPLEFNLRSCSNLTTDLIQGQDFTDWFNGNHRLYLFLDSLDEGLLEIRNLATQLVDEFKKKKYSNKLNRLYLRIACRTFVFPEILENELKILWGKEDLGIYELAPLRQTDIIEAAKIEGISSGDFIAEIESKNIVSLAIKPVTLGFLLNIYQRNNGQFPSNQRLHELYLDGCKLLCDEVSPSRRASGQTGDLDSDQRLVIAARIASVTIFANRFAVWKGIDFGNVPEEDVLLQEISQGYENANGKSFEIKREFVEETLDTGLFSSRRSSNRMGWAHQTYSEYLAAWYLVQREISLPLISKLFFSSEDSGYKLIPQLHETAAWLATMKEDFLQEVIKTDPDVLLRSDIPRDAKLRASIVDNLLKLYEQEKLFDRYNENYYRYKKLKHPELASQLRPYISDSNKQFDARELAIYIADVCAVSELQEELVNLALDSLQIIHLRVSAARAIFSVGDSATKIKLKPLAVSNILEDEDDRLKGYALRALWSENISAEELFNSLTRPKKRNFLGSYQIFIDHELVQKIQPEELVTALKWLEKQGVRCFGHPFEKLGNSIILKAWENFDLPDIAESFTKVVLVQLKKYQPIITSDDNLQSQFRSSVIEDITKRHKLIENIVLAVLESKLDPDSLIYSLTKNILVSDDFLWIIEKFKDAKSQNVQLIWLHLIQEDFNRQDAKHIDAIVTEIQNNDLLAKAFAFEFEAVDLNSDRAKTMRTYYLQSQSRQYNNDSPVLDPPPKQSILELLDKLEAGDLDAWWRLNMEMTLQPDSQDYDNEFELDLTKLSGWQEAEEVTRRRIIEGAKQYIQQKSNINYDWIGTNNFDRPALAGFRALQLLIKERLDFLDTVSSSIWKKWASVIVASPSYNHYGDNYLEVITLTYKNAPQESIDTLLRLIEQENRQYDYISVIHRFEKCWDQRLKDALLKKVKTSSLKPKCIGQLLEELLKHESLEARVFTISLISYPLSSIEQENEKTLIASRILVENSDPSSWVSIWMLIQQDVSFGRKIFEAVSYRYSHGVDLNLTETQLADLYLWLVKQYPYGEDPDYSNEVLAHNLTTRETIGNFRDSVLAQLKERGTREACTEIERLIQELPDLEWLKKTLLYAQKNMRFKSWQPMKPNEVLQLLAPKTVSNPEISDKIDEYHEDVKRMSDEPKVKVVNSQGVNIAVSNSGNAEQKINEPDQKKKFDWKVILAVLSIVVPVTVGGLFNEEVRQFLFKKNPSPPIQEKSSPNSQPR